KQKFQLRGREVAEPEARFIPFSAYTRMSGVNLDGRWLRKGATDAILNFIKEQGGQVPGDFMAISDRISRAGGTPLAVADGARMLGVVHLKDIVKGGMKNRLVQLRAMGIRSVMITGDNPLTAAAIAAEAGVDDFLAQATPEDKLKHIRKEQADGPAKLKEELAARGYTFPYLVDESQSVANAYHAACTPDFYLFGKDPKLV